MVLWKEKQVKGQGAGGEAEIADRMSWAQRDFQASFLSNGFPFCDCYILPESSLVQ